MSLPARKLRPPLGKTVDTDVDRDRVLALDEIRVRYPKVGDVLGPLSLQVARGDFLAVVGPSGCGKSTLLRVMAGLESRVEGGIALTNRDATAMVFQHPTLAPWLTSADNVALPLRLSGASVRDARDAATAALKRVGLAEAARIRPAKLSGGMAMRVALARAQVCEPRLLLLDEPFSAIDDPARRRLEADVHLTWAASNPAIVLVTHNVEEAVFLARRVLVLSPRPGRIRGDFQIEAPLPRAASFRGSAEFRARVETISARLAEVAETCA